MFIQWFSIKLWQLSLQILFVFLIGYNLQWETLGVVFSMVGHTLAQFIVRLLWIRPSREDSLTAELPIWGPSKTSEPQIMFSASLIHLSLNFCSNPYFLPLSSYLYPSFNGTVMMKESLVCQWVLPLTRFGWFLQFRSLFPGFLSRVREETHFFPLR